MISAEALQRFKRTDPYKILEDAEQRFRQLSGEEQKKLRQFIADYPDVDDLYSHLENQSFMIKRVLKNHQQYLISHPDTDFSAQEVQEHNEFIDELFLHFVFLGEKIETFPPLPVLPPAAPLIKISGVIEEVTFTRAMACFEAEVYSTVRDKLERKRLRDNIGALVAMTAQALTGTPPHAMINEGKPSKLKCLYVKGKIDGKTFSGWFGMTDIRPGDRVEIAAAPVGDEYLAYAMINISRKTISVTPQCHSGKSSYPFNMVALICFLFVLVPFLLPFFIAHVFVNTLCTYIAVSLSLSFIIYRQGQRRRKPFFELYGRISDVLAFPGGEKFDLLSHSGKIARQKREEGQILPRTAGDVPMPQGGADDYVYEFFYYY
ncbi:putative type VI secretion system effector [Enterobacteriaceae bacterium LUAb1]